MEEVSRRELLGGMTAAVAAALVPEAKTPANAPEIHGVGVVRFPAKRNNVDSMMLARDLAENIRQGTIICLPNTRDYTGAYEWDFHIEGGDPGQVKVERKG